MKRPLYMELDLKVGQHPCLKVWDDRGNMVKLDGDSLLEEAIKLPISQEKQSTSCQN